MKKKKSKLDGIEFHHKSDKGANFPFKYYPRDKDNTELYKLWDRQLTREEEHEKRIEKTTTITIISVIVVWIIISLVLISIL